MEVSIMDKTKLLSALAVLLLPSAAAAHTDPKPYPHVGDFWYDGNFYADSLFWNHTSYGGYKSSNPGFELSVSLSRDLYDACTTWANLPSFYDDCPTAGTAEPSGVAYTFGIGSYNAKQMAAAGTTYEARFYFSGGTVPSAAANIGWQEVSHNLCWWDSPWCMGGEWGGSLVKTTWNFREENYSSWNY
jgi:hypothetical protein